MSENIFERALEIIDVEFDAWERVEYLELFELVEHALKQAQRQEKLLELYKRLVCDWDDLSYIEVVDIEKKMKEIENESN